MNRPSLCLMLTIALLACMPLSAQTSYTFHDVNFTGDTFTQFLGINNSNIVAGYHGAAINKGFTYNFNTNTFTKENFPGSTQTQVTGINNLGRTVGFYIDKSNVTHGFTMVNGTFTKEDQPGTVFNQLLGQNDHAQAAGYFSSSVSGNGPDTGYVFGEIGNTYATYLIPNSTSVQTTGVNNTGMLCGFWIDGNQNTHGWTLILGRFTSLDFPGSTSTMALGINNNELVVGTYNDAQNNTHGFIYSIMGAKWQSIDDPSGVNMTVVNGINDNNTLVGFWGVSPNNTAFVATVNP